MDLIKGGLQNLIISSTEEKCSLTEVEKNYHSKQNSKNEDPNEIIDSVLLREERLHDVSFENKSSTNSGSEQTFQIQRSLNSPLDMNDTESSDFTNNLNICVTPEGPHNDDSHTSVKFQYQRTRQIKDDKLKESLQYREFCNSKKLKKRNKRKRISKIDNRSGEMNRENDHIDILNKDTASCHICVTELSILNVEEHVQGKNHQKAQATLNAARKNSNDNNNIGDGVRTLKENVLLEENFRDTDVLMNIQKKVPFVSTTKSNIETEHNSFEFENIKKINFNSFRCSLCQVTLRSYISVEQHILGRKHERNLQTVSIEHLWWKRKELESKEMQQTQCTTYTKSEDKSCSKNIGITNGENNDQVLGIELEKEIKHLRKNNIGPDIRHIWHEIYIIEDGWWSNISHIKGEMFFCYPCNETLPVKDVLMHVKSKLHQEIMSSSENIKRNEKLSTIADEFWEQTCASDRTHQIHFKIDDADTLYCISCCIKVPAVLEKITSHIHSEIHKAMKNHIKSLSPPPQIELNPILNRLEDDLWEQMHAPQNTHRFYFKMYSPAALYCTCCFVEVPASCTNLMDHICGKSHMENSFRHVLAFPKLPAGMNYKYPNSNEVRSKAALISSCSCDLISPPAAYSKQIALLKALGPKQESSSQTITDSKETVDVQEKCILFNCFLCNVEVDSEFLWQKHTCSQEHCNEMKKIIESGKNAVTYNCSLCDGIIICNQRDIQKHRCQKKQYEVTSNHVPEVITGNRQRANETTGEKISFDRQNEGNVSKERQNDSVPRLTVTGFPRGTGMNMLHNCFKEFGTVSFVTLCSGSAIIEFTERDGVSRALEKPVSIGEATLIVKTSMPVLHNKVPEPAELIHESLVPVFESQDSFDLKVESLCMATEILSDPQKSNQVCQFLETVLQKTFPGCKAIPFGSRSSGLAFADSDLDVFLDIGDMYKGKHSQEASAQELMVSLTLSVLKLHPECSDVVGIPNARTPIVKFVHIPSETRCDVAFRHGLGLENTKLIWFYVSLDPRVKRLIIFLKHWAQLHKLSGQNSITHYALAWLVIFYLQQESEFGLPSVEFLQNSYKGPLNIIAGWECSFSTDVSKIPPIKKSQSVLQLLQGFFKYYLNFDYSKNVICPLTGVAIPKVFFTDFQEKLPPAMENYMYRITKRKHVEKLRTQSAMCVQDPFDLSHNVTKSISYALLKKFKCLCGQAAELCGE